MKFQKKFMKKVVFIVVGMGLMTKKCHIFEKNYKISTFT